MLLSTLAPLISDVDANAMKGIAVIFANNTNGNWQYALDGVSWLNFGTVSNSTARLLALQTTRIRFVPNSNFNTPVGAAGAELHFVAWDRTAGSIGGTIEVPTLGGRGGTTAFSESPGVYTQFVTPVNDAPTMNPADVFLTSINEDSTNPAGTLVSDLLSGMSDVDAEAVKGMAVRTAQNSGGVWQYTLNNGTNWTLFGSPNDAAARLLPSDANTRVRFVPNANFAGVRVIAFTAWDQTSGTAGETANLTASDSTGGATAFSTAIAVAKQRVVAVNDTPTIVAPNFAAPVFGTPLVFSTANSNAITVGDIDAASGVMQIAITVTNGRFNLSTLTGITITAGSNGSSALTARGTLAALNAALAGSSFLPNAVGAATVQMLVDDLGNTGVGGPKTRNRAIELSVALPGGTVELGALNAAAPTIRRSGNRDGSTATPDFYTFTIDAASDVRVNLSGLSADVDVRVFSADGQMVGQSIFFSNTIENILMTALPTGTYLVDVRGQVVSGYDLTLSTATTSDDLITQAFVLASLNAATLPTVRELVFPANSDLQDYFKFDLTTASALRINLSNLSQDVDFELLDSAGRVIQTAGVSGNTIENMLTSSLAVGTYYIRVFAFGGLLTATYDLTISTNTTSDDLLTNATSLGTLGLKGSDRRTGSVATGTDIQDYYAFAGSGDVAISLSGLTSDVDIHVLDQFGRVLASSTNGGNNFESINLNIAPGSGTIFIRVFAFSGSSNYVLEARNNSNAANADDLLSTATALPNPITSLTRTGAVGGTGSTGDPQDYYRFELSSVRNVTVTLTGLSTDVDIEVLDQFGNLLFFSRNGGSSSETINMANLGIGTYFIRVLAFSTAVSNYTLGLTV